MADVNAGVNRLIGRDRELAALVGVVEFAALAGPGHTAAASGKSLEVRTLYEARIERLPEPTRRLLLLAFVQGVAAGSPASVMAETAR